MHNEKPPTSRWHWLRFIPLQLHIVLPYLGFLLGRSVWHEEGGYAGLSIGFAIGLPLYVLKRRLGPSGVGLTFAVWPWLLQEWDLDRTRNLGQLITGCVVAACGAAIGFHAGEPGPWQGAVIGTILGFVAGVFLSGVLLMIAGWIGAICAVVIPSRARRKSVLNHETRPDGNSH